MSNRQRTWIRNRRTRTTAAFWTAAVLGMASIRVLAAEPADKKESGRMRVAAAQPKNRTIDFRVKPSEILARVDQSLTELEQLVHKAGEAGCDVLALPEDTLGLLKWEAANPESLGTVLPEAIRRMLDRLGRAAAKHRMYLVVCNDTHREGRLYLQHVVPDRPRRQGDRPLPQGQPAADRTEPRARPRVPGLPHARPGDGRHADLLRHGLSRGGAVPGLERSGHRVSSHARRRGRWRR